jgi:subtilisin family serine protease
VTVRNDPSIVVVDTGIAVANLRPNALAGLAADATDSANDETPDESPVDGKLDSDAGHGTFIAGIIEGIVPGCKLLVNGLLTGQGDANEADVATTLESLATRPEGRPDLVNLSFGGYTVDGMERLHEAVRKLQDAGTVIVASAGNDATCLPSYPAAFPDVIAVGAIGPYGPAHFTNYGSWVRACAPGIDIVSTFFTECATDDGAEYGEWVRWSGTSFSAPAVLAVLAEQMKQGLPGSEAVRRTIDAPGLLRVPDLGAVVNRQPWY